MRKILLLIIMMAMSLPAMAQEMTAQEIVQKAKEKYQSMKSYSSKVRSISEGAISGRPFKDSRKAEVIMARPNLYKITWSNVKPYQGKEDVVWNSGEGAYMYSSMTNGYSKYNSDVMIFGAATGISSNATLTMPSIFYALPEMPSFFDSLKKLEYLGVENVAGKDCYKLKGKTLYSSEHYIWIEVGQFLLIKNQYVHDVDSSMAEKVEMSDEQYAESVRAMGVEVTDEKIAFMKKMSDFGQEMTENVEIDLQRKEIFTNIKVDESVENYNFDFKVPASAKLETNYFDAMFSGDIDLDKLQESQEALMEMMGKEDFDPKETQKIMKDLEDSMNVDSKNEKNKEHMQDDAY